MSLIKKSIVLAKDTAKGLINIIRIGSSVGAKLLLNELPTDSLWAGLRVGHNSQLNLPLPSLENSFSLDIDFKITDSIGIIILDSNFNVYAMGGIKDMINLNMLKETIIKSKKAKQKNDSLLNNPQTTINMHSEDAFAIADSIKISDATNPSPQHSINIPESTNIIKEIQNTQNTVLENTINEDITPTDAVQEDTASTSIIQTEITPLDTNQPDINSDINQSDIKQEDISQPDVEILVHPHDTIKADDSIYKDTQDKLEILIDKEESVEIKKTTKKRQANEIAEPIPLADTVEKNIEVVAVSNDLQKKNHQEESHSKGEVIEDMNNSYKQAKERLNQEHQRLEKERLQRQQSEANPFDIKGAENFYQSIRSRLDDILTVNPREESLESIIPDSKWVKVRYEKDDYYVVGVLTENNVITHIAYGVPGLASVKPPKEAEQLCDFLPVSNSKSEGYWLMFQDAKDGKLLKNS